MDFLQRLPYDLLERILNRLDLPEINRLRVLDHCFDNLISGDQFVSQYNRNRVSSLWLFFHLRGLGDNIGVLVAHRFDLHQRVRTMRFPLPFNVGDELRLGDMSGSLFLFRRRTRHPDDEDEFLVSLSVVNPFRRQVHSVEVPNGLPLDGIEFAGVRLSHEEQQQQFRISHLSLNGNQVPTYSQFLSATNQWETLFHVATPIPDNQHLNTHHPMARIHYHQDGLTYLVSFVDGQPVFRTVPTHHLIGNAFQGFPVPHPTHGTAQLDFLILYGPWAFKIYCHRDIDDVHWTSIVAVALARLRPDWTRYDRIHVSPPYTHWDAFYAIDLDAGFSVRQTGRHVSIGMVALDFAHQWCLRTISFDLLGERWREVFVHVGGEVEVGTPLFSDMLTL